MRASPRVVEQLDLFCDLSLQNLTAKLVPRKQETIVNQKLASIVLSRQQVKVLDRRRKGRFHGARVTRTGVVGGITATRLDRGALARVTAFLLNLLALLLFPLEPLHLLNELLLSLHAVKVLHVLLVGWIDAELLLHLVKLLGVEGWSWLVMERGRARGHRRDKTRVSDNSRTRHEDRSVVRWRLRHQDSATWSHGLRVGCALRTQLTTLGCEICGRLL